MSHQFQQQPRQGQPTEQYGQQPTQSMGGQQRTQQTGSQQGPQQMGGQQSIAGRQQGTQQMGGQQPMTGGQQMQGRQSFESHLTNELRIALEDFTELSNVADWCAKECASEGRQLATCAQICHDIAELADLNESLIARDSMFGPEVAETFVRVATESLPELQQYQQHPHIAETISVIDRTIDSCSTVLGMVGGQGTGGQGSGGQQFESRAMGSQQPMTGGQQGPQQLGGQQPGSQGMTGGRGMGGQR